MNRVMIIVGDELDALKFSPLVRAVEDVDAGFQVDTCIVTQNADSVLHTLQVFGLQPDSQMETIPIGKNLCTTVGVVVENVTRLIEQRKPDAVLVCGSSAVAMGAGLAANHMEIPLGHIEAGIRSGQVDAPFPEELLRRQLADLACWHFASSEHAVENLLAEGIGKESIYQVGSCSIDALRILREGASPRRDAGKVLVVLSYTERIAATAKAIKELSGLYPDRQFNVFIDGCLPVSEHPAELVESAENISICKDGFPSDIVRTLLESGLVIADSGYVIEMGAALGIPTIIVQEQLDRPEAVNSANALFVSDEIGEIARAAQKVMNNTDSYSVLVDPCLAYGEGYAAQKITAALKIELQLLKHADTPRAREMSRVFVPMFASLN